MKNRIWGRAGTFPMKTIGFGGTCGVFPMTKIGFRGRMRRFPYEEIEFGSHLFLSCLKGYYCTPKRDSLGKPWGIP